MTDDKDLTARQELETMIDWLRRHPRYKPMAGTVGGEEYGCIWGIAIKAGLAHDGGDWGRGLSQEAQKALTRSGKELPLWKSADGEYKGHSSLVRVNDGLYTALGFTTGKAPRRRLMFKWLRSALEYVK